MRNYLALSLLPLAMYPIAIALVIGVDTGLGDAEFLRSFLLESRRETLRWLISDWLTALPWCLMIWISLRIIGLRLPGPQQHILLLLITISLLGASLSALYLPLLFATLTFSCFLLNVVYLKWLIPSRPVQ